MSDEGRYRGQEGPGLQAVKPPEKHTAQIERAPIIEGLLRSLQTTMQDGFASVEAEQQRQGSELVHLKAEVHSIANEHRLVRDRVLSLEQRSALASERVKGVSENDLAQEAKLADVIIWRKTVEDKVVAIESKTDSLVKSQATQTEMLATLVRGAGKLFADPKFLALIAAIYSALMYWLGKHGGP